MYISSNFRYSKYIVNARVSLEIVEHANNGCIVVKALSRFTFVISWKVANGRSLYDDSISTAVVKKKGYNHSFGQAFLLYNDSKGPMDDVGYRARWKSC